MREALKVYAHWKYEADKELQKRTAFKWTQVFPGHLLDDPGVGTATIGKSRLVNNQIRVRVSLPACRTDNDVRLPHRETMWRLS